MAETIEHVADSLSLLVLDLRNGSLTHGEIAESIEEHTNRLMMIVGSHEHTAKKDP